MILSNIKKITDLILSIRKDKGNSEMDFDNIEENLKLFEESANEKENLVEALNQFSNKELLNVFTFYYYGRDIVGKSESDFWSFYDQLNIFKDTSRDDILNKLCDVQKNNLESSFKKAFENFEEHEKKIPKAKEKYDRRQKSFIKKNGEIFFDREENFEKSNSMNIEKVFNELKIESTQDIKTAKIILENIINNTDGLLSVDFLGSGCFDRLAFVETDDEVLKLYWKYSQDSMVVHNNRVDIKFDKLELLKIKDIRAITIRGFYADKKWIKNYYNNIEKAKINSLEVSKTSTFFYDIDFDKTQRGGKENFIASFLPWRYYSIVISAFDNNLSSNNFNNILILKNINEIEKRIIKTYYEFELSIYDEEDSLSMYGNRFRKILESLLKFILLASGIMYKDNYEKDTLGLLLEQLGDKESFSRKISLYNDENLDSITAFVKKDLLDNLNFCSHENVSTKFDKSMIENIFKNMLGVLNMTKEYFKF